MYAFPMSQLHAGAGNARVRAGFPCVIACDCREPALWEQEKYGYTLCVDPDRYLKVL